jgi:hypothetical protein
LTNLSTDTQTIAKLNTRSLTSKLNLDKSNSDSEPAFNKDTLQQTTAGAINNAVITTLAETPC